MAKNILGSKTKYSGEMAEQGTQISGYATVGPYFCGNCVHESKSNCYHPAVMKDPKLKKFKQPDGSIKIDEEHGCCRYVNPGKKE